MRLHLIASVVAVPLLLAACATTPTGKSVVSAPVAGSKIATLGATVQLAEALYQARGGTSTVIEGNLTTAASALTAAGKSLEASTATSGDLQANVDLGYAAINAVVAALPAQDAAQAQGYEDTFLAVVALYNAAAPTEGLPTVPVPGVASVSLASAG